MTPIEMQGFKDLLKEVQQGYSDIKSLEEQKKELQNATKLIDEIIAITNHYNLAVAKHPEFPTDIFQMLSIMQEEAGEASKAVNDYYFSGKPIEDVRLELRQTAAMCIRMLINL